MFDDMFGDLDAAPAPADTPVSAPPADGPDIVVCQEPGCGMELEWSGRGRKPKFCDEHKRRTSPKDAPAPGQRRPRGFAGRLENVQQALTEQLVETGAMVSVVLPCTGITLTKRSERTAAALANIAADNPRMLEILEQTASILPKIQLGKIALEVGVAVLVDTNRVNPDGMLAMMTGISEVWHDLHDEESPLDNTSVPAEMTPANGVWNQQVPPRFMPVG